MSLPPIDIPRLLRALGISRAVKTEAPPAWEVGPDVEGTIASGPGLVMQPLKQHLDPDGTLVIDPVNIQSLGLVFDGILDMDAVNQAARELGPGILTSSPTLTAEPTVPITGEQILADLQRMYRRLAGPWYVTLTDQDLEDNDATVLIHHSLKDARELAQALNQHVEDNRSGERYRHRIYVVKYLEG